MSDIRREDIGWIRGMFGLSVATRDRRNLSVRQTTIADSKFADTTLGGNAAINSWYQFTRYADIPAAGLLAQPQTNSADKSWLQNSSNSGSFQEGRFYSEVIDDTAHLVHMRFGVAKYTGSIAFFANMYDREAAALARDGVWSKALRTAGTIAGTALIYAVLGPAVLIPLIIGTQTLKFITGSKPSKYYYLKQTMNLYLQALSAMCDTELLHYRLVPMMDFIGNNRYTDVTESNNKLNATMQEIYKFLPDIWKSNGKFDVYKMVNRHQILANYHAKTLSVIYNKSKNESEFNTNLKRYVALARNTNILKDAVTSSDETIYSLAKAYMANELYQTSDEQDRLNEAQWQSVQSKLQSTDASNAVSAAGVVNEQEQYKIDQAKAAAAAKAGDSAPTVTTPGVDPNQTNETFWGGFLSDMAEQGVSELKDGSLWMTYRVDARETISDSLSNSTKEPEISSSMKSMSSRARTFDFSTSGGNTGFDAIDAVTKGIKSIFDGLLDSVHLTNLAAIYGRSIVDIPDVYEDSSANIGTVSYTFKFRTPYGNDFSIFQDCIFPTLTLLAGGLPIATGKQTYTSPFLVEVYARGRQTIRLGIFESISITRGTGNMGWRADGKPLGIDVTVSIKDLSRVPFMPLLKHPSLFDDSNKYTDYMATLGAASLHELTYGLDQAILNANKWRQSWKSAFMSGRITNSIGAWKICRVLSSFTAGTVLR